MSTALDADADLVRRAKELGHHATEDEAVRAASTTTTTSSYGART